MAAIRVLIVDDSAFMRKMVSDILGQKPEFEVVGTARNGQDGLEQARALRPDVITLDVEMPVLDGLATLAAIMKEQPTPVVMLSSLTAAGADTTMRALHLGAVDFVHKPSGAVSLDIGKVSDEITSKVAQAARANLRGLSGSGSVSRMIAPRAEAARAAPAASVAPAQSYRAVVAIGTSTGGPRALQEVIPRIPGDIPAALVIVQHMPPKFTKSLADRLDSMSQISVSEAEEGDILRPGHAFLAPGGYHMRVTKGNRIALSQEPPLWGVRPAADLMLESVALEYGPRAIGVIMTGMGHDGAAAMKLIKQRGGMTIAESEETCVIYGMPRAVVEAGAADHVLPLGDVAGRIAQLAREVR
jgi:two-component system, chemotaxis family, protein-glutamate methylesterase/glutaminase